MTIFACDPIPILWDPKAHVKGCLDLAVLQISLAGTNAVIDGLVLALPIVLLSQTQIDPKRKGFIIGIFALGSVALLASFARFMVTVVLLKTIDVPNNWALFPIFTALEVDIAITSASLPALSPLIRAGIQKVANYAGPSRLLSRFETSHAEFGDTKTLTDHRQEPKGDGVQTKSEYTVVRITSYSSRGEPAEVTRPDQWRESQAEQRRQRPMSPFLYERRDMSLGEMLTRTGPDQEERRAIGRSRSKANEVLGV
jgi:hypothetical protein